MAGARPPSLMGGTPNVLPWATRWKIALGSARGLRFLHEDSQVHRFMQPNNLGRRPTAMDFTPVGLWMSSCLCPDLADTGSTVTGNRDVYAFGIMLLELITGRKAVDTTRSSGQMTLIEWANPLIQAGKTQELVDPRLNNVYNIHQLNKMVDVAGRCINLAQPPTMSEVLPILESNPVPIQSGTRGRVRFITPRPRIALSYDTMIC